MLHRVKNVYMGTVNIEISNFLNNLFLKFVKVNFERELNVYISLLFFTCCTITHTGSIYGWYNRVVLVKQDSVDWKTKPLSETILGDRGGDCK